MVVTQVWLEVKNGRTIVLDAETARKQLKKKRKGGAVHPHAKSKKRKHNSYTSLSVDGDNAPDDEETEQLFADAQAQLQQEMAAAGVGQDALPMSFGSTNHKSASTRSSRKRQRQTHTLAVTSVVVPVPVPVAPVEKVHVTFDSDGEIAERVVETVVIPPVATEAPTDDGDTAVDQGSTPEATAETPESAPVAAVETPDVVDPAVLKFWKQRRSLFHKYDDGIQLDHESWYSVTPESIAQHIATRCACDVVVDPFSGCGGNIIQFAKTCKHVIAIEIDAEKIRMAKANAAIYGVADRIEWIHGDAIKVLPTLHADVVFLSPPWGGMNYNRSRFGIQDMRIGGTNGVELFEIARRVAKNVVYYLPKTTPEDELQALAPDEAVECEHIYLNGQLKVVNAYYGDLAELSNDSVITK